MSNNTFKTGDLAALLPRTIADGMIEQAQTTSTVARLSQREPMEFGDVDYVIFNDFPRAEFVDEGAPKSATKGGFDYVTATPKKAQVTMRFNEEVLWADADHKLRVLQALGRAGGDALSRALDLGLYHRINPLSGTVLDGWTNYIDATTYRVKPEAGAREDDQFNAAVDLLVAQDVPVTGAAFDPKFSNKLARLPLVYANDSGPSSMRQYPELGTGQNITTFESTPVAVGNTVSGGRGPHGVSGCCGFRVHVAGDCCRSRP